MVEVSKHQVLKLYGARENNLKNLNISLKHDSLIVVTGVSGSGKSTLAIDTIYAEGGRRYIETFSPYTRQFLDRLHQPKLDGMTGVRPALALEQRNRITSSRSTVGTVTEINDYLKVLWAHLCDISCPECGADVQHDTPATTMRRIAALCEKAKAKQILLIFPLPLSGTASLDSLKATLQSEGFGRFYLPKTREVKKLDELSEQEFKKLSASELCVIADRIIAGDVEEKDFRDRLLSSVNQAYTYGHGRLTAVLTDEDGKSQSHSFSEALVCNACGTRVARPRPYMFSFNSPLGACGTCHGFGRVLTFDPDLCIPNPNKSLSEGAIVCWDTPATSIERKRLKAFCEAAGIDYHAPWSKLPKKAIDKILNGSKNGAKYRGLKGWFDKLQRKRHKMHVRVFLSRFRGEFECTDCNGERLKNIHRSYRVAGKTLPEIWLMPIDQTIDFFQALRDEAAAERTTEIALDEALSRLQYLVHVGLGYLTLDRQSRTLSGGESQRVNLTAILGSRLVNTLLVLDEPTIGLHQRDTHRLIRAVRALQERGNTVILVEHDTEVVRTADEIIDIGPRAGSAGGNVVFQGPVEKLLECKESATAEYLRRENEPRPAGEKAPPAKHELIIRGARAHNLKNIDVRIPLERFTVLTGVSGSGKSSFLTKCLYEPFCRLKSGMTLQQILKHRDAEFSGIEGREKIDEVILIDQSPIGKTPRSNPATYTKAWDVIRDCLAESPDAQRLGLGRSAFSFNVDGGRCPVCSGAGSLRIEMQFLADVFVECEACNGLRFQDKVLSVQFAGKNVVELLEMSLDDAVELFRSVGEDERAKQVLERLQPLIDLGLGYLRLGHPLSLVSGGEAQRIKIASYLKNTEKGRHLFILDEPTTGLHPKNIEQLLAALRMLTARGHSILCVEHNFDVIEQADWIIDLGPEAGEGGGTIVAEGTPAELAQAAKRHAQSHTAAILNERNGGAGKKRAKPAEVMPIRKSADNKAIEIVGGRHHNLKNISVAIPHNTLSVVTGVSGSGKSTLAFDIIFAEGQRRYIDSLSPYARQYMKQLTRAEVDRVSSLPPTIAVSQKTSPPLGISTIATTTELYQYLRLLYSKVGTQHCPIDDTPITSYSTSLITEEIARRYAGKRIFVLAPVVSGRKGYYNDLFQRALRAELSEARIDGKIVKLSPDLRLERHKLHWISLFVGSITAPEKRSDLLKEALDQALVLGAGTLEIIVDDKWNEPEVFSTARVCPTCKRGYRELDPQDFSFRSARGVCPKCSGRGFIELRGGKDELCPECAGARIGAIGRHVTIADKRIFELTELTAPGLLAFLKKVKFDKRLEPIIEPIMRELFSRLEIVSSVGLDYLKLDRDASTISGGEAQRLRLAKTLGSPLTGVCYVLDEPSIGLHPQDQTMLMDTLVSLRDAGNTLVVVEHDEETIRAADHVIDIGPLGGAGGGRLVAQGTVEDIERTPHSVTGAALRARSEAGRSAPPSAFGRKTVSKELEWIELTGATANNLKNIDVRIPLGTLTVVCGVSGAGKSSLVHGTLAPAVIEQLVGKKKERGESRTWKSLQNARALDRLLEIDQSPVGKTPASTPASYLGIFDDIRKIYAALPEARAKGWSASHFSFNTGKGRCPECGGRGFVKIPMSFLPDATTLCESCNGFRYNEETAELLYQGLSLGELLQKTMSEAREILGNHRQVRRTLEYVHELGLGYLTLGQPTHTLSGGEAQRLKIACELGLREAKNTLYILDEPTIGLHMADVEKLLRVIRMLVDKDNTVVVIEHNLDVLRAADYLIEVGPGPGEAGGELLFQGPPEKLASFNGRSPTKPFLFPKQERTKSAKGIGNR